MQSCTGIHRLKQVHTTAYNHVQRYTHCETGAPKTIQSCTDTQTVKQHTVMYRGTQTVKQVHPTVNNHVQGYTD